MNEINQSLEREGRNFKSFAYHGKISMEHNDFPPNERHQEDIINTVYI
jgi:hypothetical protein